MIFVGTAIENDLGYFLSNGGFGDGFADHDGFFGFGTFDFFETLGTNRDNYNTGLIINKLGPKMSIGP
jgi:hypothetical protein